MSGSTLHSDRHDEQDYICQLNKKGKVETYKLMSRRTPQKKIAAKLHVTFPTINRWGAGRAKPSPLALKRIEGLIRNLGERGDDLLKEIFGEKA